MSYEPIKFPGWRFGPDGQRGIFECAADVPKGWTDNPNDFPAVKIKPDDPNKASREELYNALDARGIDYDKRWKDDRLKALLA